MNKGHRQCKACGEELASNARYCPNCGTKSRNPFFRKWWFWVVTAVILMGVFTSCASQNTGASSTPSQTAEKAADAKVTSSALSEPERTAVAVDNSPSSGASNETPGQKKRRRFGSVLFKLYRILL